MEGARRSHKVYTHLALNRLVDSRLKTQPVPLGSTSHPAAHAVGRHANEGSTPLPAKEPVKRKSG